LRMLAKTRDIGTATLVGSVIAGAIGAVLSMADISYSFAIGALIGGGVGAYLLYGKVGQAALVGALSGLLGVPFFLGLSQILAIFELIPIPPGPQPSMAELQVAVFVIFGIDTVVGVLGGAVVGTFRHPPQQMPAPPPPPGYVPPQARYCVQCGAQLPAGAVICPHCNARQPQ
jgi:hypothetical protein